MLRPLITVLALLLLICDTAAAPDPATDETVKEFVRICLATLPDTKKVRAYAEIEKWEPLPPEAAPLVAPADPSADWKAWFVRAKKQFIAISNGKNPTDGNPISGCVVAGVSGNHKDAISALLNFQPDLKRIDERTEAGQHVAVYTGTIMGYPLMVSVTGPLEGPGMILSGGIIVR